MWLTNFLIISSSSCEVTLWIDHTAQQVDCVILSKYILFKQRNSTWHTSSVSYSTYRWKTVKALQLIWCEYIQCDNVEVKKKLYVFYNSVSTAANVFILLKSTSFKACIFGYLQKAKQIQILYKYCNATQHLPIQSGSDSANITHKIKSISTTMQKCE